MATKKNKTGAAPNKIQAQTPPAAQGADQAGQEVLEQKLPGSDTLVDPNAGDGGPGGSTEQPPVPGAKEEARTGAPSAPKSKFEQRCEEVAKEYAPHYPASKAFHFCSDMQVFLEGDKAEAQAHQLSVDPKSNVFTINV